MDAGKILEEAYRKRVTENDIKAAKVLLWPNLSIDAGPQYDSNKYNYNSSWADVGVRLSWNVLKLAQLPALNRAHKSQNETDDLRRMALSMAVLTQTHVAYRHFNGRLRQYQLSSELDNVEQRILVHTRNATRNDAQGKLQEVRVAASALMSELRLYQTYGALQGAYGQVLSTMGLDPLPPTIDSHDLSAIRGAVRSMESRWAQELGGGV